MFELLFKYSPVVYEKGEWVLQTRLSWLVFLGLGVIAIISILFAYRQTTAPLRKSWRAGLVTLRLLALVALAFCLLEPALSVSTVVTQKSSVLILVDDSKSMSIADDGKETRIEQVANWLGAESQSGRILERLNRKFRVERYRFSTTVERLDDAEALVANGKSTNLGRALEFAARKASQGALSGVVLVTDGAASAGTDPLQAARELIAANVPVFTVGVGAKVGNDIQITKVDATRSVLEHSVVEVNALIQSRGHTGRTVELELREGKKVLQRQPVTLREHSTRASMQFTPTRPGFTKYTVAIRPQRDELVVTNNQKSFLTNSRDKTARILYVEELHPWEYKFISRALDGDPAVQLTSLLQTGPEKYLRLGLRDSDELLEGFPNNRTELFQYQAIVFGSVAAGFFSSEQLDLVRDFVAERGGGFMMLGGMRSLAQGNYQNTAIAEILPVELPPAFAADGRALPPQLHEEFRFTPTTEYLSLPLLQLDPDPIKNSQLWEELPLLQGYNPVGPAKPAATVLAVHPLHRPDSPRILLATQRYGRGRTAVLATSSTWRWQMRMDHRNTTHERFWRQLMRWLSLQSPHPVTIELDRENFSPGETVMLHVDVRDSSFMPLNDASVTIKIVGPKNHTISATASPEVTGTARYLAPYEADTEGLHRIEVLAYDRQGKFLGKAESAFMVEPSQAELANIDIQVPLLQRLAELTAGRYFHLSQSEDLPDAITVSQSSFSKLAEHDIWDAPIFFVIVVLLLGAEWFLRRARGLS